MVGKAKWKPQELPLPGKRVIQKQQCIPRGIEEFGAISQEHEGCRGDESHHYPIQLTHVAGTED